MALTASAQQETLPTNVLWISNLLPPKPPKQNFGSRHSHRDQNRQDRQEQPQDEDDICKGSPNLGSFPQHGFYVIVYLKSHICMTFRHLSCNPASSGTCRTVEVARCTMSPQLGEEKQSTCIWSPSLLESEYGSPSESAWSKFKLVHQNCSPTQSRAWVITGQNTVLY